MGEAEVLGGEGWVNKAPSVAKLTSGAAHLHMHEYRHVLNASPLAKEKRRRRTHKATIDSSFLVLLIFLLFADWF